MDIVGEESALADADLLAAALDVLRTLGLTGEDVVARYSDRRLLHHALLDLGVSDEKLLVAYNVIDKVERDPREVCVQRLREIGLSAGQAESALSLTDVQHDNLRERFGSIAALGPALEELERYAAALGALGFADYIEFDMKIVRGLAYYTGIVFEIFDRKGKLRAICGGGRYDNLFFTLTGIDIPALGFGFGDVVLGELLKDRGLAADYTRGIDFCIVAEPGVPATLPLEIAAQLRSEGKSVVYNYKALDAKADVGKQLKYAATSGAANAVLVGASVVKIKNLGSGEQSELPLEEFRRRRGGKG